MHDMKHQHHTDFTFIVYGLSGLLGLSFLSLESVDQIYPLGHHHFLLPVDVQTLLRRLAVELATAQVIPL